jgi:uncharacterized protein (TIGR00369 family)
MPLSDEQLVERFNTRKPPTGILFKSNILEVRSAEGFVRMSYDIGPEFCNPSGAVQGGIVTAMLDDAAAFACIIMTTERIYVPTLELKTSFLGAAYAGLLYAEARCIKFGKSIAFMEAELLDGEGKVLAKMSTTAAPRLLKTKPNLIAVEGA